MSKPEQTWTGGDVVPRGRGRTWSVGAHLAAVVVIVLVMFGGLGVYSAREALGHARNNATRDAAAQADVAGKAVAATWSLAQIEVAALAGNPSAPAVFNNPAGCRLSFALDLIPSGHLDLVTPDGRVICSSFAAAAGRPPDTHAGAAWLAKLMSAKGLFQSTVFRDRTTGLDAVVIGSPVADTAGHVVGAVAFVATTGAIADMLGRSYGGAEHYQFAIADNATGAVVAATNTGRARSPSGLSHPARNPIVMGDFLYGSAPVAGLAWKVFAGVRPAVAMGPIRSILLREGALAGFALVVILVLLGVIRRRIALPLAHLTAVIADHGSDVTAVLAGTGGTTEVARLASAFQSMVEQRDAYEARLSHQALHDPLTGLPNRALLADRLEHALAHSARGVGSVGVLFLDIDRFKVVNDSLGHRFGDQVLVLLGARLANFVRSSDTLVRFGGDEFVIVCEGLQGAQQVAEVAGRLGELVARPLEVDDRIIRVTASIGIALAGPESRADDLIRNADVAMYVAKENGGARHEFFDQKLCDNAAARLTLESELRSALERAELHVVYQPQILLATGTIIGVEALLRWQHPALGSIPPDKFIPVAEETGLIIPIGRFVLEQASRQAATWRAQGHDLRMAVNISGRQLSDPELARQVAAILHETGLPGDRLCLELTESVLMADAVRTAIDLRSLKALGVDLSIDDFGTGYSSLSYLQRFPVDELKIDRGFVADIVDHRDERNLVAAMVAMGRSLGLQIVAEGVETLAQADQLRSLGCEHAQGYLFARPESPDVITDLLTAQFEAARLPT